jgi:hypothetical protein
MAGHQEEIDFRFRRVSTFTRAKVAKAPVVHNAPGGNHVSSAKLYVASTYSISGTNPSGWIASGCF